MSKTANKRQLKWNGSATPQTNTTLPVYTEMGLSTQKSLTCNNRLKRTDTISRQDKIKRRRVIKTTAQTPPHLQKRKQSERSEVCVCVNNMHASVM